MPESFAAQLLKDLEEAPAVSLFVHQFPDPDCKGSSLGLKGWLQSKYPDKPVYAVANLPEEGFDQPSDEQIQNSLGIILDVSNAPRVEDPRWKLAQKTYRIDHHVPVDCFADREWIDDQATATCEMIALMLEEAGEAIPASAAQKLYEGLIADNLRFGVDKVRPESFMAGAYLVKHGANVVEAVQNTFASSYDDFAFESMIRSKAVRRSRFLFTVLSAQDYLGAGHSFAFAKEKVFALADITDIEVWALFTQMEDGIHYSASLRSRTIPIRDLAVKYGGGGHDCASGIKHLTIADVTALIEQLEQRSLQNEHPASHSQSEVSA